MVLSDADVRRPLSLPSWLQVVFFFFFGGGLHLGARCAFFRKPVHQFIVRRLFLASPPPGDHALSFRRLVIARGQARATALRGTVPNIGAARVHDHPSTNTNVVVVGRRRRGTCAPLRHWPTTASRDRLPITKGVPDSQPHVALKAASSAALGNMAIRPGAWHMYDHVKGPPTGWATPRTRSNTICRDGPIPAKSSLASSIFCVARPLATPRGQDLQPPVRPGMTNGLRQGRRPSATLRLRRTRTVPRRSCTRPSTSSPLAEPPPSSVIESSRPRPIWNEGRVPRLMACNLDDFNDSIRPFRPRPPQGGAWRPGATERRVLPTATSGATPAPGDAARWLLRARPARLQDHGVFIQFPEPSIFRRAGCLITEGGARRGLGLRHQLERRTLHCALRARSRPKESWRSR